MARYFPRFGRAAVHCSAALLATLILAACAGESETPPPCPLATPLSGADKLVRFDGEGRDLTDVEFEAEILDLQVACVYDGPVIETTMRVRIAAAKGPANRDDRADLVYFVAILTHDRQVAAWEAFDVSVPFSGNLTRLATEDEVYPRIPLKAGENGDDYTIVVGLEMSRSELDYNRANR